VIVAPLWQTLLLLGGLAALLLWGASKVGKAPVDPVEDYFQEWKRRDARARQQARDV
jgi:hypothetical protein